MLGDTGPGFAEGGAGGHRFGRASGFRWITPG